MKKIRQSVIVGATLILFSATAFSQPSSSQTEKVKISMKLTGSSKQYKQFIDVMINSFKKNSPNVPSAFRNR